MAPPVKAKGPCGTTTAYKWHLRQRKVDPFHIIDKACRDANNKAQREYRKNNEVLSLRHNFMTRTMSAAQTILAQRYPEEFREILEKERDMELTLMRMQEGVPWEDSSS